MKLLKRNLRKFEYLPYTGVETDLDDQGRHTGDYKPVYGYPIWKQGNISVPSGYANQTFYGLDTRYSHVLVMENPDEDIQETGLIRWNGELYDIKAVRPSLNSLSVALMKRTVNHEDVRHP